MQIHELTEASFLQKIKSGTQQAVSTATQAVKDIPAVQTVAQGKVYSPQALAQAQQQRYAKQAAQAAQKLQAQGYKSQSATPVGQQQVTAAIGGARGEYFKTGDVWTNELGQTITNPQSIAYLDSILANTPKTARPTGSAQAVMTTPEFNQALAQAQISPRQLETLRATVAQNPSFTQALLKRLGLKR